MDANRAGAGYVVAGVTESTGLGLLGAVAARAVAVLLLKGRSAVRDAEPERSATVR